MGKLTVKTIQALKAGAADRRISDGDNLYLVVTKAGTKNWVFMWKDKARAEAEGRKSHVYPRPHSPARRTWRKQISCRN